MTLKPRKTPSQARSHATVDAILTATAQLLSKGGLAAFNTNAVAERAGVSIGSLYQYFPNKDALMVALIERQQQRQLASLQFAAAHLAGQEDMEIAIRMLVRGAMAHHREDSLLATVIDHEEARLPVDAMLNGYLEQGGEVVAAMLKQFGLNLSEAATRRAVRTLPALVRATTDAWANLDPPQVEMAEDEAVRAVLGYLQQAISSPSERRS